MELTASRPGGICSLWVLGEVWEAAGKKAQGGGGGRVHSAVL